MRVVLFKLAGIAILGIFVFAGAVMLIAFLSALWQLVSEFPKTTVGLIVFLLVWMLVQVCHNELNQEEARRLRYRPLETGCDLSVMALLTAAGSNPQMYLNVPEGLLDCAHAVLRDRLFRNAKIRVVRDDTLGPHEWFLSYEAIGSNGP